MKKIILIFSFFLAGYTAQSQILISLLLGDKLNSDKLEFGLDGGCNISTIQGLEHADYFTGFNLGFYFDIRLFKNHAWMMNTGVIVKSPHGAQNLPVYSLNDLALDNAFKGGEVERKLRYFNVPILIKYQFKNKIFAKGGVMLGLKYKAFDEFRNSVNDDDDLKYVVEIKDQYTTLDAGLLVGVGYRLIRGNGMNIGFNYYQGLVDILKDNPGPAQNNSGFYFTAGIPIGKEKPVAKTEE